MTHTKKTLFVAMNQAMGNGTSLNYSSL